MIGSSSTLSRSLCLLFLVLIRVIMAAGEEKSSDFYAVLGLKKECTASELRSAYKKLALRWHPDRCSALGNSKFVEEAKKKFQTIQEAYSVLSDANKRFLYDVGAYDDDSDDDEIGMGDFLGEMAVMMSQTEASENGQESFEDLQELFEEMFQRDIDAFHSTFHDASSSCNSKSNENKRNFSDMSSVKTNNFDTESTRVPTFCVGTEGREDSNGQGGTGRRRNGRKQKVSSSRHHASSQDSRISA